MKCPKDCDRCCRYLRVETVEKWDKEFCKARGIKQLPYRCPHLKNHRCDLGSNRPRHCKEFWCEKIKNGKLK